MPAHRAILFVQLPRIENDVSDERENLPMAARYLRHAVRQAGEDAHYSMSVLPETVQDSGDAVLIERIAARRPDLLACTLYLWNIERTLALARELKRRLPKLVVIAGGPEAAPEHPFLFREAVADVVASGEGEPVFPAILRALRLGRRTDFHNVAWRVAGHYRWGRGEEPELALREMLPPPGAARPDARGRAVIETMRGCPMRCAYCCYNQRRPIPSCLDAEESLARIEALIRNGAREIRFIDPTFNANPAFEDMIRGIAAINRGRRARFFAELRADWITEGQARALARAGFAEIEVGVQCLNARVLRILHRPGPIPRLDAGIRALADAGIRVTLDLMYGLPGQTLRDIRHDLAWAAGRRRVRVQCMQTLLLPGTELREQREELGIQGCDCPPYAVTGTRQLPPAALQRAEEIIEDKLDARYDCPTRRFAGEKLPDLFAERMRFDVKRDAPARVLSGASNRRAVLFAGKDLFGRRDKILAAIRIALEREPWMHWQFVIAPVSEEPLDLLDAMIAVIQKTPRRVADHLLGTRFEHLRASVRVFALVKGSRFSASWQAAAEALLRQNFF